MNKTLSRLAIAATLTAAFVPVYGFAQTTTIGVTVGPEASLTVNTSPTLTAASAFANYTGNTTFTYKIRTTKVGGVGTIVLQITTDFAGVGGPSVATPPTAGDTLTYNCTVASGTACTAGTLAKTTATTSVATFGANAHSSATGDAGTLAWSTPYPPDRQP